MDFAVTPPAAPLRPKFAHWLHDRRITLRPAAARLNRSREYVRKLLLPFGDPARKVPDEDTLEIIVEWTGGECAASDFYPPHLNGGVQ